MPSSKAPTTGRIYQLKITLARSKPPIWRRVLVGERTRLDTLHHIIQCIMPWTDSHLHQFTIDGTAYTDMRFELDNAFSEKSISLETLNLEPKSRFHYEYDFGDGWEHDILVEKVLDPEPDAKYPVCIKGARACPPDDCGGIWGYYNLLETLNDPNHPEHEDMLEWAGGPIDPEAFDIDRANQMLRHYIRAK